MVSAGNKSFSIFLISTLLLITFHGFPSVIAEVAANDIKAGDCTTYDFSPCNCYLYDPGDSQVICDAVNMTQVRDGPFSRVENFDFYELILSPLEGDVIPANFIQSAVQRIQTLTISCFQLSDVFIQVDPLAFESNLESSEYDSIVLFYCNFPNLNFFSGIKKATQLRFQYNTNVQDILQTIPIEFQLDSLSIQSCDNLDLTLRFPSLINGLTEFIINFSKGISDDAMDRFMQWMVSTSANTLSKLDISSNELTKIPTLPLSRFTKLTVLNLGDNPYQSGILTKGSLSFAYPLESISLMNCKIKAIEPGAFEGDYSTTSLLLGNNLLTRFESSVFQPLLEQMIPLGTVNGGNVIVGGNAFDCYTDSCHLTWLLRDNRALLDYVINARCSDLRRFEFIQANDPIFDGCP